MGSCFPCNFVGALRPIGEVVSQAKFGCNVNNVRHPMCMCHLDQLGVRWGCLSLALIVLGHIAVDAAFQPPVWRAQVSRTTSVGFLSSRMATNVQCLRCQASIPLNSYFMQAVRQIFFFDYTRRSPLTVASRL